jgi:hypothetical protein
LRCYIPANQWQASGEIPAGALPIHVVPSRVVKLTNDRGGAIELMTSKLN